MNARHSLALGGALLLLGSAGCSDPCLDDGFSQSPPEDCPVADDGSSSETTDDGSTTDPVDTCGNGVLDDGEADIDCGGTCAGLCDDGSTCGDGADCMSGTCSDEGVCVSPSCDNDVQDGDETDVDCGGACTETCDDGQGCQADTDCTSGSCGDDGTCEPAAATCNDGEHNGTETDVDCGGDTCDACTDGQSCGQPEDCASGVCDEGTCVQPTDGCRDGELNGTETDVDCGGDTCGPCDPGQTCEDGDDCSSTICSDDDTCAAPACDDGALNGTETDIDCGGDTCDACNDGQGCDDGDDCLSGVCTDDACQAPACDDGVLNGDETDIDCGGDTCGACDDGDDCGDADDCLSGVCTGDVCQAPACDDGIANGDETDIDCGGDTCDACDPGETCVDADDCTSGGCEGGTCNALLSVAAGPACNDSSGGAVALSASGAGGTGGPYTYSWTPDDGSLATPDQADTTANPTGFQTYTVTVDDGLNTASDTVVVLNSDPFDLENNCTLYTAQFSAGGSVATIAYDMAGTRACEAGNNDFGLHLCEDVVFESTQLSGVVEITNDAGDDDWVGLVWGAQDASHYYSLVWKGSAQMAQGCLTPEGVLVKRIEADAFEDLGGADFYCPADTANSTVLALPADTTTQGWTEAQQYDVTIDYTPTGSDITITPVGGGVPLASFSIVDDTYPSGSFGSTTRSQANACVGPLVGQCLGG